MPNRRQGLDVNGGDVRRTSLHFGVACLKRVGYSVRALDERRRAAELCVRDVLVWTNERLQRWLVAINLKVMSGTRLHCSRPCQTQEPDSFGLK
ncbi:jg2169 [Pararge aegeria aegeria]|uniref:Jg2169 protein n=1 Tax=Pararge aegeria aegeria TaxID=348720 RepID=A0A8S4QHX4_9NEOP|nr:jg2169 [Pararge aegeria aegeria]